MSSKTARHALTMNILRIAQLQASLTYERSWHLVVPHFQLAQLGTWHLAVAQLLISSLPKHGGREWDGEGGGWQKGQRWRGFGTNERGKKVFIFRFHTWNVIRRKFSRQKKKSLDFVKQILAFAFSQVGVVVLCVMYAVGGARIYMSMEVQNQNNNNNTFSRKLF